METDSDPIDQIATPRREVNHSSVDATQRVKEGEEYRKDPTWDISIDYKKVQNVGVCGRKQTQLLYKSSQNKVWMKMKEGGREGEEEGKRHTLTN